MLLNASNIMCSNFFDFEDDDDDPITIICINLPDIIIVVGFVYAKDNDDNYS
jgi:hypothetical protein